MLTEIQSKLNSGENELSRHALDQGILRRITLQETLQAIPRGEIIEDYPEDKYGPSCLIFGTTSKARPLHVQCSYPSRPVIKINTLYEPDPAQWIDFRKRKD